MTLKDRFFHYVWGLFAQAFNGAIAAIMATITVDTTASFVPDVKTMNFHTALAIFVGAFIWNALYYFKANPLPSELPEGGQLKQALASVIPPTVKAPVAILLLILSLGVAVPMATSGCQGSTALVVATQTLKAVGESAEATVATSAQMYVNHQITASQARAIMDFYDLKFQPAFRAAAAGVNVGVAPAPGTIVQLASDLANLLASYKST